MSPETSQPNVVDRRSTWLFVCLCAIVFVAVVGYAVYSRRGLEAAAAGGPLAPVDAARVAETRLRSHVLFRVTALGPSYGQVGMVPVDTPTQPPVMTGLTCDRVYASRDNGLCLQADRGVFTTYRAIAFDASFAERHSFKLAGAPSRTRVASSAPLGVSTVFVTGDSYAGGNFSTRTNLYDLRTHAVIADLETFTVLRDGQPFKRQDFNFWGVTFRDDGERFYATLATGGALHLVEGVVGQRGMTVIGADVECPMLSPDGTRLAYKRRMLEGGRVMWRLRVLDLDTRAITDIQEARNVDDQPEWMNNAHLLYALPRAGTGSSDIWTAPADGTGSPQLFIPDAFSPAVVRTLPATAHAATEPPDASARRF